MLDTGRAILIVVHTVGGYEIQFKPGRHAQWERWIYDDEQNLVEQTKGLNIHNVRHQLEALQ